MSIAANKPPNVANDEASNKIEAAVGVSEPNNVNSVAEPAPAADDKAGADNAKAEAKSGQKQAGGKDRKPRRERPPLPDPLPEKLVTKYPEPSKAEMQKKIDEHDAVIQECFDKLAATRQFYDRRSKIRDAGKAEFDAARKRMTAKNDELKVLFDQRKTLSMEIKSIRDADMNARNEASSSGGKEDKLLANLKTVKDVDDRIKELENIQATTSLSNAEEKMLVKDIAYLRHTGRDIILGKDQQFKDAKAAKATRQEKRAALEAQRKEIDKKIDGEKVVLEKFRKEVDGIRAKQDAEIQKISEETANIDRDKVRQTIADEKAKIRKVRDDFSAELDQWYLNERIYAEQIRIQRKKRQEARNAEREARRKAWEEEQAQYPEPDPYQKEKDMIAGLTVYLQTILGETVEKTSGNSLLPKSGLAPSLKTEKSARTVSTAGKAIGKNCLAQQFESLAFSDFMEKKAKKGRKGRRQSVVAAAPVEKEGEEDTLKPCSIDLLAAFTHLEIAPPKNFAEARTALTEVKKKKDYYDSDPPAPEPKENTKEAPKKKAPKPNGKTSVKEMQSSGAFPGLNGGEDVVKPSESGPNTAASRPSFSDIAKGSAAAPAPAVEPNVYPPIAEEETKPSAAVETDGSAPANHEAPVAFTES